jgi:hypothetical protein
MAVNDTSGLQRSRERGTRGGEREQREPEKRHRAGCARRLRGDLP